MADITKDTKKLTDAEFDDLLSRADAAIAEIDRATSRGRAYADALKNKEINEGRAQSAEFNRGVETQTAKSVGRAASATRGFETKKSAERAYKSMNVAAKSAKASVGQSKANVKMSRAQTDADLAQIDYSNTEHDEYNKVTDDLRERKFALTKKKAAASKAASSKSASSSGGSDSTGEIPSGSYNEKRGEISSPASIADRDPLGLRDQNGKTVTDKDGNTTWKADEKGLTGGANTKTSVSRVNDLADTVFRDMAHSVDSNGNYIYDLDYINKNVEGSSIQRKCLRAYTTVRQTQTDILENGLSGAKRKDYIETMKKVGVSAEYATQFVDGLGKYYASVLKKNMTAQAALAHALGEEKTLDVRGYLATALDVGAYDTQLGLKLIGQDDGDSVVSVSVYGTQNLTKKVGKDLPANLAIQKQNAAGGNYIDTYNVTKKEINIDTASSAEIYSAVTRSADASEKAFLLGVLTDRIINKGETDKYGVLQEHAAALRDNREKIERAKEAERLYNEERENAVRNRAEFKRKLTEEDGYTNAEAELLIGYTENPSAAAAYIKNYADGKLGKFVVGAKDYDLYKRVWRGLSQAELEKVLDLNEYASFDGKFEGDFISDNKVKIAFTALENTDPQTAFELYGQLTTGAKEALNTYQGLLSELYAVLPADESLRTDAEKAALQNIYDKYAHYNELYNTIERKRDQMWVSKRLSLLGNDGLVDGLISLYVGDVTFDRSGNVELSDEEAEQFDAGLLIKAITANIQNEGQQSAITAEDINARCAGTRSNAEKVKAIFKYVNAVAPVATKNALPKCYAETFIKEKMPALSEQTGGDVAYAVELMGDQIKAQRMQEEIQSFMNTGNSFVNGLLDLGGLVLSVASNILTSIPAFLETAFSGRGGRPKNYYGDFGRMNLAGQQMRQEAVGDVSRALGDVSAAVFGEDVRGEVEAWSNGILSGAMSVVDSYVGGKVFGSLAGAVSTKFGVSANVAMSFAKQLTLFTMSSGAGYSTMVQMHEKGYSDREAVAYGWVSALAEYITETINIDTVVSPESLKGAKATLWNMFEEGTEEVGSNIINDIYDMAIMRDRGEIAKEIEGYVAEGADRESAARQVIGDHLYKSFQDFVGGALGGGVGPALGAVGGKVGSKVGQFVENANAKAETRTALGETVRSRPDLMEKAKSVSPQAEKAISAAEARIEAKKAKVEKKAAAKGNAVSEAAIEKGTYGAEQKLTRTVGKYVTQNLGYEEAKKAVTDFAADNAKVGAEEIKGNKEVKSAVKKLAGKTSAPVKNTGVKGAVEKVAKKVSDSTVTKKNAVELFNRAKEVKVSDVGTRAVKAVQNMLYDKDGSAAVEYAKKLSKIFPNSFLAERAGKVDSDYYTKEDASRLTEITERVGKAYARIRKTDVESAQPTDRLLTDLTFLTGEDVTENNFIEALNKVKETGRKSKQFEALADAVEKSAALTEKLGEEEQKLLKKYRPDVREMLVEEEGDDDFVDGEGGHAVSLSERVEAYEAFKSSAKAGIADTADMSRYEGKISAKLKAKAVADGAAEVAKKSRAGSSYAFLDRAAFNAKMKDSNFRTQLKVINALARKWNIHITFTDMLGNGDIFEDASNALFIGGNQIVIDINTDYGMLTSAFTHEAYHYLEENNKRAAAEMKKLVFDMLGDEGTRKARTEMRGRGYAEEYVDSEIVADSLFDVLSRKGLMKQISKETRMTVSEMLLHLADGIRDVLMRFTGTESWRADMRKQMRNYELLSNMFEEAMTSAADDVKRAGLFEDAKGERRHSIKYTTDNKPVVVVEENILDGVPKSEWIKTVKEVIRSKFSGGIPVSGRLIKVNRVTRNEYVGSAYSKTVNRFASGIYRDKFKAANNLDEIVIAGTNYINEDLKHARKDSFKEFARGDILLRIGQNDYSANIIVGFTSTGEMVLYDLIGFQKTSFAIKKRIPNTGPQEANSDRLGVSSDNTISQNESIVNTNISESGEKYSTNRQSKKKTPSEIVKEYESPITPKDVETLRSIGRKSVNSFTGEDIQKASKWAHKFYKELGTKSPFFRAWFGEYRAHEKTPVKIATIPEYIATNEARKANRGTVKNSDTGWDIRISREGETNTISHAGDMRLSEKGLSGIRELVENAVLLDSEVHEHHSNNSKNDLVAFDHKLYTIGKDTDGNVALYRITVEEGFQDPYNTNDKKFHNLKYIEKVAETSADANVEQSHKDGSTMRSSTTEYIVSDICEFVKKYDKEFNEGKEVNPSLLNKDGTPKVWYHSTNADFTSFKQGSGVLGNGIYFSDYSQGLYGKNIKEAYLTAENPVNLRNLPHGAKKINSAGIETSVIPNFFEKFPQYDAIVDSRHGEIVVKNSEQIKSATDNIGTFDKGNKDIRFSKKKEPANSLKAEDVFGSDYRKEYTSLKAEAQGLRNTIAEIEGNGDLTDNDRAWRTEKLRDILEAKENTMKRMDNMREILAQMQTVNKNSRRYAKLFMNALATVRMTGTYRSVGDSWEVSKTLSEITDTYEPTLSELMSDEGLKKLQKEHKQIYDAFMEYVRDKSYLRPFDRKDYKKVIEAVAKEYKAVGVDTAMLASEVKNAVEVYLNKPSDIQGSYESLVRELDVILSDITDKGKKLADSSPWAQSVKGKTVKLIGEQYSEVINTFGSLAEANRYMNGAVTFSRVRGITLSEALDGNNAAELLSKTNRAWENEWEVISDETDKKPSAYGGKTGIKAYSQQTQAEQSGKSPSIEILDFAKAVHEMFAHKADIQKSSSADNTANTASVTSVGKRVFEGLLEEKKNSPYIQEYREEMKKISALAKKSESAAAAYWQSEKKISYDIGRNNAFAKAFERDMKKTERRNLSEFRDKFGRLLSQISKKLSAKDVTGSVKHELADLVKLFEVENKIGYTQLSSIIETVKKSTVEESGEVLDTDAMNLYSQKLEALKKKLNGRTLNSLNSAEMRDVYQAVRAIYKALNDANKVYLDGRAAELKAVRDEVRREIAESNRKRIARFSVMETANPMRFAEVLSNFNRESTIYKTFADLEKAEYEATSRAFEYLMPFDKLNGSSKSMDRKVSKENLKKYKSFTTDYIDTPFEDAETGEKVRMSRSELLQLYMTWVREVNSDKIRHLQLMGFELGNRKMMMKGDFEGAFSAYNQTSVGPVTPQQMSEVRKILFDNSVGGRYAEEWLKTAQEFFRRAGQDLDSVYYKRFFVHLDIDPNYIPLVVDSLEVAGKISDTMQQGEGVVKYEQSGKLKEITPKAPQHIKIAGIHGLVLNETKSTANIVELMLPLKQFRSVWGTKLEESDGRVSSVQKELAKKFSNGDYVRKYIDQIQNDLAGKSRKSSELRSFVDDAFDTLNGSFISSVLNTPSVIVKQISALPVALHTVSYKNIGRFGKKGWRKRGITGLPYKFIIAGKQRALLAEYEQHGIYEFSERLRGTFSVDMARANEKTRGIVDWLIRGNAVNRKLVGWYFNAMVATDANTCLIIGEAVKQDVADAGFKVGTAEYWDEVKTRVRKAINYTQQVGGVMHGTELQKTANGFKRTISMFTSQTTMTKSMVQFSAMEAHATKGTKQHKQAVRNFLRTVAGFTAGQLSFRVLTELMRIIQHKNYLYKDDDDDKIKFVNVFREIGYGFVTDCISTALIVSPLIEVISAVAARILPGDWAEEMFQTYGASDPRLDAVNDFCDLIASFDKKDFSVYDIRRVCSTVGTVTGLPAEALWSFCYGLYQYAQDISSGIFAENFRMLVNNGYYYDSEFENVSSGYRAYVGLVLSGETKAAEIFKDAIEEFERNKGTKDSELEEKFRKGVIKALAEDERMAQAYRAYIEGDSAKYAKILDGITQFSEDITSEAAKAYINAVASKVRTACESEDGDEIAAAKKYLEEKLHLTKEEIEGLVGEYTSTVKKNDLFGQIYDAWSRGQDFSDLEASARERFGDSGYVSGFASELAKSEKIKDAYEAKTSGDLTRYESILSSVKTADNIKLSAVEKYESTLNRNIATVFYDLDPSAVHEARVVLRRDCHLSDDRIDKLAAEYTPKEASSGEPVKAMYKPADVAEFVKKGDTKNAKHIVEYLKAYYAADGKTADDASKAIRAKLTAEYKDEYRYAYTEGDTKKQRAIISTLVGLDVGYDESTVRKWCEKTKGGHTADYTKWLEEDYAAYKAALR